MQTQAASAGCDTFDGAALRAGFGLALTRAAVVPATKFQVFVLLKLSLILIMLSFVCWCPLLLPHTNLVASQQSRKLSLG
jgi:hypothetical protein